MGGPTAAAGTGHIERCGIIEAGRKVWAVAVDGEAAGRILDWNAVGESVELDRVDRYTDPGIHGHVGEVRREGRGIERSRHTDVVGRCGAACVCIRDGPRGRQDDRGAHFRTGKIVEILGGKSG